MREVEINRMIYENLIIAKTIGFVALFLIICIVLTQVYDYLKTRPHNRKQKKVMACILAMKFMMFTQNLMSKLGIRMLLLWKNLRNDY